MKRGVAAIVGIAIAIVLGAVLLLQVVQPVLNSAITSSATNLSGYSAAQTVANQLPTLNVVGLLVIIAGAALVAFRAAGGG